MIRLLVFVIFMLCGTGLFYLVFVHQLPKEPESEGLPVPTSDVTLNEVHVKQHRGSELQFELFADSATYNEQTRQAYLTTVRFQVFQSNADPAEPLDVKGTAARAFLDDPRQRVLLQGQAHITKDQDQEVRGDVIDYYVKEGLVKARGKVEIRDKESRISGDALEYNIRGERIVVTAPTLSQ